jgi:hypothetical protein
MPEMPGKEGIIILCVTFSAHLRTKFYRICAQVADCENAVFEPPVWGHLLDAIPHCGMEETK